MKRQYSLFLAILLLVTIPYISIADIVIFYGIPIAIGLVSHLFCISISSNVFDVSVAAFSIFGSLLLSVQMALLALYHKEWREPNDKKKVEFYRQMHARRNTLLKQLNTNISYMVVVSIIAVLIFVSFYAFEFGDDLESSISIVIYVHFSFTLIMCITGSTPTPR